MSPEVRTEPTVLVWDSIDIYIPPRADGCYGGQISSR